MLWGCQLPETASHFCACGDGMLLRRRLFVCMLVAPPILIVSFLVHSLSGQFPQTFRWNAGYASDPGHIYDV